MSLPIDIEEKYEVLGPLGAGGMGEVFKVRHRLLDELRVVKVLRAQLASSESVRVRFQREAQAAIRLRHLNIAEVYDFSVDPRGTAFLVMEFIDGLSLKELLDFGKPPSVAAAVEIAHQSLEALGYLHERGYLHRDVSPGNLMLTEGRDGGPLVKLIDLGLAKEITGSSDLTATGMFVGTVRYASPERFKRTSGEADPRGDLYSFGAVFYELLTGTCPILGSSFEELVSAHLLDPVPDFDTTDLEGRVPKGLRKVVLDSLEKDPAHRIPSAAVFAQRLEPFRTSPIPSYEEISPISVSRPRRRDVRLEAARRTSPKVAAAASGTTIRASQWFSRNNASRRVRLPRVLGVAAVLVSLAVLGLGWWRLREPSPPPAAPGRILIEATPWAQIQRIVDAAGYELPLRAATYTPVSLPMPEGRYEMTLEHPDLETPRLEIFEVVAKETTRLSIEVKGITADDYLEALGLARELREAGS